MKGVRKFSAATLVEIVVGASALALGLIHTWAGRYSMNPDGISYLDLGDAFAHRDWQHALNAWWSPFYAWVVGIVGETVKPSPRFEFPLVHIVNFFIFLATLSAFRFCLHQLIKFSNENTDGEPITFPLPKWCLILLGYAIFLWTSLQVVSIYGVGPDLLVMLFVCLIAGSLLSLHQNPLSPWRFALVGLVLGIGYWAKTILLPLGMFSLLCAYTWKPTSRKWRVGIVIATFVFICVAAPLIILLSKQKGRLTIGETGRLNYAHYIFPRMPWANWQGEIPGGGKPLHPTRKIMSDPAVYEFAMPVGGTFPPWTDPSYWNEGVQPRFRLKAQLQVLAETVPSEIRILLTEQPDLVVGVIVLALLSGQVWWTGLRKLWPLIAISLVGMAAYLPLVVNDRYLGGFVLVLFLAILAAVRLRGDDQRCAAYVTVAVFIMMTISTLDLTARYATHHLANPGAGPNSTLSDLMMAEALAGLGYGPGESVAFVADGSEIYWARLAKLHIIAEVDAGGTSDGFWKLSNESRRRVYETLSKANAKLLVAHCSSSDELDWKKILGTNNCVMQLEQRR